MRLIFSLLWILCVSAANAENADADSYKEYGKRAGGHVGGAVGGVLGGAAGGIAGGALGGSAGTEIGSKWGEQIGESAHEIDTKDTLDDIPIQQYPDYGGAAPGW